MNKHLLFILVVFSIAIAAKSQTNVSGNITSNTTWTKANSPYVLVGNVGVPSAYTLTIKPGVTVQRSGDYQILINGAVRFNGTVTDSIIFSSGTNLTADSKFFIEFQKSNFGNSKLSFLSFQNSSELSNNIFTGNTPGGQATIPQNTGTLHLSHCNLSNGYTVANGYINLDTTAINIDSCYISAGYIQELNQNSESINISNSQVYNTTFRDGLFGISFINCYLSGTSLPQTGEYSFVNCTVENSRLGGILDYAGFGNATMNNCTFTNTSLTSTQTSFYITNCNFAYTDKVYNLDGSESNYLITTDGLSMSGCQLINNSSYQIGGINLSGTGYGNFTTTDTIVHNQFSNLYDAVTVNYFPKIILDSNNFSTVGRYDIINYTNKDFSALYNYFQLKQGQTIDDVIYDQNDDLSYGLVTYTPYATDPLVLPLKLLSFTGNRNGQSIQLNWQTSNEVNTLRFVVQRTTGSGFTDIGTIAASGKAGSTANYYFTDETPAAGTNEYRLKIIDGDGKYAYSAVVPIVFTKTVNGLLLYPNPAKNYVIVQHAAISNDTQLQLIDATGKLAKIVSVVKGSTQTKINVAGMAKGTYRIIWQTKTKKESQLLFVQ